VSVEQFGWARNQRSLVSPQIQSTLANCNQKRLIISQSNKPPIINLIKRSKKGVKITVPTLEIFEVELEPEIKTKKKTS
jgi:hypothetical protein